ncbi:hypothetical protein K461DRAFT_290459 [Myriangium duriaei CBS 260.36]|uniref:Cytochrome b561 domain-containing protein n=1 Tax=Myriangium duriaei CBS 260.36 TaxID=1168546 RepID=A0A9P4JAC1_9PEZI|nr:hypothetical protein K461DRAFT_290459 [Myriangium duriaei CBS 260.36]
MAASSPRNRTAVLVLLSLAAAVNAHEHHGDKVPAGEAVSQDPIDAILWTHILIQGFAWGILYPLGMVLGIIRSRWHVPCQILASALAIVGYFLGHAHKGRQFTHNVHASFANWLMLMVAVQGGLGVYLKLHLERGLFGKSRSFFVTIHGVLGKALPVAAWVQMLFGGIVLEGFCRGDHLGQCLAHFIMGSAFIGYGIMLTILLLVGQAWLKRRGKSQEFFDSAVIAAWGCVNTFTEHRWGGPWVGNDLQHTTMGIIWWSAGLVGMWLSRDSAGRPKRNIIPGMVILLTGWAMSGHPQHLMLSTMVHTVFGYTLMAAGLTRIIEISFVLRDRNNYSDLTTEQRSSHGHHADTEEETHSFQFLPVFLLYASGFMFMGATEEQMQMLSDADVTHVSYVLILFSCAFILFLFVNLLLRIYSSSAGPQRQVKLGSTDEEGAPMLNGHAMNGSGSAHERRQVRQAEEFELEGLISDDEDARPLGEIPGGSDSGDSGSGRRKERRA